MKTILNFLKSRFFWLNIIAVIVVAFMLGYGVLLWIDHYTHHGERVSVPDLSGIYPEEAEVILQDLDLICEVVDSLYIRELAPGEIAEQTPVAGTAVKKGRKIYVTVNQRSKRMVEVPYLVGESRRKAQSNLLSAGFRLDSVVYRPYEFDDEVLDMYYGEQKLVQGDKVPDGAHIRLVVGRCDTSVTRIVPNLLGLSPFHVESVIEEYELSLGVVSYDIEPESEEDKALYRVYSQTPAAGTSVYRGKIVNLKFSKTRKEDVPDDMEHEYEEEFF